MSALRRFAAAGAAPVYPAVGRYALSAVEDLALDARVSLEATPRHANLLLVAGGVRDEDRSDLHRLHDQLPHPRATVWWRSEPDPKFEQPVIVDADENPVEALARIYEQLVAGARASDADLLPNEPPAPWRGEGDHGQGGKGMMGGTPYGRPMAMTEGDLRDGLALDAYAVTLGPFLPMLPPGLVLDVTLQGDMIQAAKVRRRPFPQAPEDARADALRRIARLLRVLGLPAQAHRFVRAASAYPQMRASDIDALRRSIRWSGAVKAIPAGLGTVQWPHAPRHPSDSRGAERDHDARSRFRAWWETAARDPGHGPGPSEVHASDLNERTSGHALDGLLPGLEWNEAVLLINSFDIETLRRMCAKADTADETPAEHGH